MPRRALDTAGLTEATFTTRVIADQAEAERAHFTGSPAFLPDGRDPFAEPDHPLGLACRTYRTADGGLTGVPDAGAPRQALEASTGPEQGRSPVAVTAVTPVRLQDQCLAFNPGARVSIRRCTGPRWGRARPALEQAHPLIRSRTVPAGAAPHGPVGALPVRLTAPIRQPRQGPADPAS